MVPWLVERVTYPLHEWLKGQTTVSDFAAACERERWTEARLLAYRRDALRRMLAHAYERSAYYRERFDAAGVRPDDLESLDDLARFPFLGKEDIRSRREEMVAFRGPERKRLIPFTTGGSTGEPTRFYVDRTRTASEWACCWRARAWWGLGWGDPWIWLWGSPIEASAQDRVKRLRDSLLNRRFLSAFHMSPETMDRYAQILRTTRPRYLYGYASSLFVLARHVETRGVELGGWSPAVVFTTGDTLYPHMREAIERVFGSPVSIEYGSRDGGFIAHECPAGGLHVHADRTHVEIVRAGVPLGPGEPGEIVVTNLDAFGMPYIRYRTGDVGSWKAGPCACGRALPLLGSVEGRSADFLLARGDRLIHSLAVVYILREIDAIAEFRIVQPSTDRLVIDVVAIRSGATVPEETIRSQVNRLFGYDVAVEVRRVQALPPTASGKHRYTISEVAGRYFGGGAGADS